MFLKIPQNSQKNNSEACNSIKRVVAAQVFSCEFYKNFKQTYSVEHFEMIASEKVL